MIHTRDLAQIVKGSILSEGDPLLIDHLLIDSRRITHAASSLFIPLISARRNGHQYIQDAYNQGVRCFICSENPDTSSLQGAWIFKVEHTLLALQQLAVWHRQQFQLPVWGITGSNGKTIVKEWLYQLLEPDEKIVRSPKSYNSQIGVALSVWAIEPEHTLGIFEAGISEAGEMDQLEKMIRPNTGVFTNIGETHNEGFLNMRHKINEKLKLFRNASSVFYNKDYHELHDCILQFASQIKASADHDIRLINWSRKSEADLCIKQIQKHHGYSHIEAIYQGHTCHIQVPFTDDAYIEDSIHCWLVLLDRGLHEHTIHERMGKLIPIAMRLELMKGINNCTLINDSYNSDVSSFSIALDYLAQQQQHERKTVILSDILQSGRDNEVYDEVADLLHQKKVHRLIGIGESIYRNKNVFRQNRKLNSTFFKSTDEFLQTIDISSFDHESILIKGARKFEFEKIAKRLQDRIHQTVMEINLNALVNNYNTYKSLLKQGTKIMAMVKAFSYGSGSFEVASRLQVEGVDYLAVAYTDEGIMLRKQGLQVPMMVMNPDDSTYDLLIEWNLEPEIYNFRSLHHFMQVARDYEKKQYPIHIKLDTGMHRLGFEESDMEQLLSLLSTQHTLRIASVFSHLAGSEDISLDDFTKTQSTRFRNMIKRIKETVSYPFLKHLCNSSGIVRHPELHFEMVRLGLGLYGIDSSTSLQSRLQTVGRLRTVISQIKEVSKEETIGYNRSGVLQRDTRIGTVCIGYADGIPRRLGNGVGHMLVDEKQAPIIGNVCMDMCMLDITDIPEAREGDQVWVFHEHLSVKQLATWAETIPYEILTGISQRVKRVFIEE